MSDTLEGLQGPAPEMPSRQPGWSVLAHIGAHGTTLPAPTADELGLAWVVNDVCERLWLYSRADFEPFQTPPDKSPWRETCALAGSIAESLMLAVAGLIEIAWHEEALQAKTEPAGMAMAQRFLADSVCETTIAVGHRLINLVARVARTDEGVCAAMDATGTDKAANLAPLGTCYIPFATATDPKAWLSLENNNIRRLRRVAPSTSSGIATALDRLRKLELTPAWKAAFVHRSGNFHRGRLEHETVAGVDSHNSSYRPINDHNGERVGTAVSAHRGTYTAADGLGAKVAADARAGLEETARAAGDILSATLVALTEITGGYVVELDTSKRKYAKGWP